MLTSQKKQSRRHTALGYGGKELRGKEKRAVKAKIHRSEAEGIGSLRRVPHTRKREKKGSFAKKEGKKREG